MNAMTPAPRPFDMSDMSRIEDAQFVDASPRIGRFVLSGLIVAALFVGGSTYWAASSKLDGAVVAPASFVVEGNRKTVDHLDGGIVRAIHVADGDMVEAGQLLFHLDSTDIDVELDVLGSQLGELGVRQERLLAQIGANPFDRMIVERAIDVPMIHWDASFRTQKQLFDTEARARASEAAIMDQRIVSLDAQIDGLDEQRASNAAQLAITQTELAGLRTLLEKGLVAVPRLNAREIEIERLRGEDAALRTRQAQLRDQIGELRLSGLGQQTLRDEAIATEIASVQARAAALRPQYAGTMERLRRVSVTAPVSGRVVNMTALTAGGVIRPGAPVLDIVPSGGALVVEARVGTGDVDSLRIGQATRIRLSAFEQGDIPEATGQIITISADSLEDDRTGEPYFLARIALDETQPPAVAALDLLPGMPADLFIGTGERTALNYLIRPLTDRLAKAFVE